MVFKFLRNMFGASGDASPAPSAPDFDKPAQIPVAPPSRSATPKKVLLREEILDARCRIAGYRYRKKNPQVSVADYVDALERGDRVKEFSGKRMMVIHLDPDDWQQADFSALVGAHTLFELAPHAVQPALLDQIRATGAGIAVTHDPAFNASGAMETSPDLVFYDLTAQALENLERDVTAMKSRHGGLQIAVGHVGSWTEQRFCLSLGVAYLLGNFVDAADEAVDGTAISESRTIILEMLSRLRADASPKELAEVAKRDPATALKLLSMANSPMYGLSRQLASIDQAIVTLGRETLYRWLTMALFRAGGDSPRLNALLEHALYRARFLELAGGQRLGKQDCDELFLIGLLSYTDVLLDLPMQEVLHRMQVVEEVRSALLKNEGRLSPYLNLVLSLQRGDHDRLEALSEALGLTHALIAEINAEALDWAAATMEA